MESKLNEQTITGLLKSWRSGEDVMNELMPLVYQQLRNMAWHYHGSQGGDVTIRPTMLVHEAFLCLQKSDLEFNDRTHFFAAAALTMRRLLIDFARNKQREKRGAGLTHVEFDDDKGTAFGAQSGHDILALNEALEMLEVQDQRKAKIIELHYFGGLNYDEIASVIDISAATVGRELKFTKAWLANELQGTPQ